MEDVNLKAIRTIKECFDISVGYSDHTCGIEASIAAVAIGAQIIEKHITLDKICRVQTTKQVSSQKNFII